METEIHPVLTGVELFIVPGILTRNSPALTGVELPVMMSPESRAAGRRAGPEAVDTVAGGPGLASDRNLRSLKTAGKEHT